MYDLDHTVEPVMFKCITEPFYKEHMLRFAQVQHNFSVICHSLTQAHVSPLKTFGKDSISNINFDNRQNNVLKRQRAKVFSKNV